MNRALTKMKEAGLFNEQDMQTAVNAGFLPVGVLWGFRQRDELEENGAQVLLEKPADLLFKVQFKK